MSLDIYIETMERKPCECICESCGNKHFTSERTKIEHFNLTHNLNKMAMQAGLYDCVWRPEENEIEYCKQMIDPLIHGINTLKSDPERFKKMNPSNGWGCYENLLETCEKYLEICEKYPDAIISACR